MQKIINKFFYYFPFLLAIVFSIKSLREPDLWWQIRTGEWIIDNKKVPTEDIFSFVHTHTDWINIKWGFEVLAAFVTSQLGVECVFLIQMFVSVLIVYFLYKTFALFKPISLLHYFVITVFILLCIEYRIIGRPEMFSHLFCIIFQYIILHHLIHKSRYIYLLIPLQILWCNMHEAYFIGVVQVALYAMYHWFLLLKKKPNKLLQLSILTLLVYLSNIVNPRGVILLYRPFNIFTQVQNNKYTTELDNIFSTNFWYKESIIFLLLIAVILLFLIFIRKKVVLAIASSYQVYWLLTTIFVFALLSITAYRNVVFFYLISAPFFYLLLISISPHIIKLKWLLLSISVVLYILIINNTYYRLTHSRDRYGWEVLSINNPIGVAQYIEQHALKNKKCFSDYLTSSYLLWKLQPDFKTYIDLRDLDVFTQSEFEHYANIINEPQSFLKEDSIYQFDYVVLFRNAYDRLHQYLYNDSVYACVFADPVACIYQKTDNLPHGDFFSNCIPVAQGNFSFFVNRLFNPLYKPHDYDNANFDFEAATYYTMVGKISFAEKRINQFLFAYPQNENAIALKNTILNLKSKIER